MFGASACDVSSTVNAFSSTIASVLFISPPFASIFPTFFSFQMSDRFRETIIRVRPSSLSFAVVDVVVVASTASDKT